MPIVEITLLIKVGGHIGALNTAGLVVLTAVIGGWLLRQQGLATLLNAKQRMASGEIPASEMVQGLLLAVGGALLLTPGFVTDAFGLLLLLPTSRKLLAARILQSAKIQSTFVQSQFTSQPGTQSGPHQSDDAIEGEFHRRD